jgi:hypothetical protein
MSERDDEREVERLYRQLPREEPPAALDAKLRAEARRAVISHPAPLVAPTGRRSWYFPVAAAAVIVLAVAVTWQVEREQGDEGAPLPQSAPAPALRKEQKLPEQAPQKQSETLQYAPLAKRAEKPAEEAKNQAPATAARNEASVEVPKTRAPAEAARDQAPAASVSGTLSQSREDALGERENRTRQERPAVPAAPSAGASASPQGGLHRDAIQAQRRANVADEPPEKWLERIAQLRQQGRHDEADKALAEFRKRYPGYRIPEAMLEKVEKR